jgi:hypothetical protein
MTLLFEAYRRHSVMPDELYAKNPRVKRTILAFQRFELELEREGNK